MKPREIASSTNAFLKRVRSLSTRAGRKQHKLILLEGRKLVEEALLRNIDLVDLVTTKSYLEDSANQSLFAQLENVINISLVDDRIFKTLYTTTTTCGIIATAKQPQQDLSTCFAAEKPLLVVADQVQDPGNLGTIIRTCLAFKADGLILLSGSTDPFAPKVIRSSLGAIFDLTVIENLDFANCVELFREHKITAVGFEATAARPYWELPASDSLALIFGNEAFGLSSQVRESAPLLLSIPMAQNCESLNVAISAGIVLAHVFRQRAGN
jgi:TrmH family RNA methyltransferase